LFAAVRRDCGASRAAGEDFGSASAAGVVVVNGQNFSRPRDNDNPRGRHVVPQTPKI
jgi:hypothetical protein